MKKLFGTVLILALAGVFAKTCLYTVNEREYALVFMLGELRTVVKEPGLHVKLPVPIENVVYLDKRILTIDTPNADLVQTSEKKNLMIDSYVKWRIADPRRYWVSFQGSEKAAEDRVSALLRDVLNQAVNRRTVNDITSRDRAQAMSEISEALQKRVTDLGIEVVDVRLKRVDFTPAISESVYSRMEAERKRVASEERSKGAAEAEKIKDAAANETYAKAFGKDPEFAKFYRSLDAYRSSFNGGKDMMVLDPSSEFFDYLKKSTPAPAQQ
jgi:membrane protease subunit HflC